VSNAYLLTLSSLLLLGGAASDRFGLRNVFVAGIAVFVVASIGSALAPNPPLLIAARAIQGAGAAFMVPGSLAIIARAYPKEERGGAIGVWAAASSLTTLLGPVIGGFLLTWLGDWSWRLIFGLNLPLGGIAIYLLMTQTPADKPEAGRRLDILGAATATVALLLISLAFIDGASGRFWIYLVSGLVILGVFLFWETRSKEPMLPLSLFADRAFSGAQGLTLVLYFGVSALTFYLPMTLISGWGVSPAIVSIALLPLGIALTLLSPFAGKVTDRLGPGPVLTFGSLIVGAAFLGLGLTVGLHNVWFVVLPLMAVFGIGMSFVAGPGATAVVTSGTGI
jgi:MFS family permease